MEDTPAVMPGTRCSAAIGMSTVAVSESDSESFDLSLRYPVPVQIVTVRFHSPARRFPTPRLKSLSRTRDSLTLSSSTTGTTSTCQ
eukprot:253660-Rhodomonas_salina.1